MNRVAVLMSTYNGALFIKEQIDSILNQEGVDIDLWIRDDGSSDSSLDIISGYNTTRKVHLIKGINCGVGNSFMELVYHANNQYDYYAFADQDDIWLQKKIITAIDLIKHMEGPCLYTSNQTLVDEDGKNLGIRYDKEPSTNYKQIICKNHLPGCTMLWNKKMQAILQEEKRRPSVKLLNNRIHDVWVAMVASICGKIVYDENSYIKYRQHANNVVGAKQETFLSKCRQYVDKLKNKEERNGRSLLAKEIYLKYGDYLSDNKDELYMYGFYNEKLSLKKGLFFDKDIIKYSGESRIAFIIKVLFNLF